MKKKIEMLKQMYLEIENNLLNELERLENGTKECNCNKPEFLSFLDTEYLEEATTITLCLNCGGRKEN